MRIKKLLFIIPTLAFFAVFLLLFTAYVPNTASALTAPSLELSSFERAYGDFVLDQTKWTYSAEEDVFISYGNIMDGKYVPLSCEDNGEYQYECKLHLLVVDENGDISASVGKTKLSKPYDSEGNCILSPTPSGDNGGRSYSLHQGSFKLGTKDEPFARIYATEKGKSEELSDFSLTVFSSAPSIMVKKRQINVGFSVDEIPEELNHTLSERTVDLKTVYDLTLNRTFAIETRLALEDVDSLLVFNHKISDFIASAPQNNGMYLYDNVGAYDTFTLGNNNVVIEDESGNDVTDYYEIVSDYNVQVNVGKLKILAPVYEFESVYLQDCIDINNVSIDEITNTAVINNSKYVLNNFIGSSVSASFIDTEDKIHYFDYTDNLLTNYNLTVKFDYVIKSSLEYFYPSISEDVSEYSLYVNQSVYNPTASYECIPVLVSVDGYEKNSNFNNNDNFELICEEKDLSSLKITKRTIILYAEGAEENDPTLIPDLSSGIYCFAVSTNDFSNPYGYAYRQNSSTTLGVDTVGNGIVDTYMDVTFKIRDFNSYLSDPNFHTIGDKVILNVGEYAIVPENITDWRYNATIHESLHYTVTPKELSLNELFENNRIVNQIELNEGRYIIAGYNFDSDPNVYQTVELKFTQKLPYYLSEGNNDYIEIDPTFSIKFYFNELNAPGVYTSTGICTDEVSNYILNDLSIDETSGEVQNIAIRIYNKLLTVSIEDIEYDGTTPEIVIIGKSDEFDYEISKSYCSGSKYASNKVLSKDPVDAGTYTVRLQLKESNVYSFEGGKDYIDVVFNITKRQIVVTVTAVGDKTFGTKGYFNSPTDSNIATYTVEYNGDDKSKPALINNDKLGNLSSDAAEVTAKPNSYKINTSNIKNSNYDITFKNSSGFEKAEYITVVKLTKEISELKDFAKNNACVVKISGQKITLSSPTLFGVVMPKFKVSYSIDGNSFITDNVNQIGNNIEISNLTEGTTYTIRYTITKNSDYLALPKDVVCDLKVTTTLTAPDVEQNIEKSSTSEIFVNLYNYQNGTYFAIIEDFDMFASSFTFDIPENCISIVEEIDEYGDVISSYAVLNISKAIAQSEDNLYEYFLMPDSEYYLYVLRKTDFCELKKTDQDPLTVATVPEKLSIKKSDIQMTEDTITVDLGEVEDFDVYVIEYIVGESKKTITSILDDDVDLSPIFQKENAEIIINDGLELTETLPDTIYYLKIYKEKRIISNGTEITIKGEPIYFEIHTPSVENNTVPDFIMKISGYIGVVTLAVLAVALIIFTVLYSKLRRKWRIK